MRRLVLACDTATETTAVGVGRYGPSGVEVLAACDTDAPRAAMSRLLPCVEDVLASLSLAPADLDEVVVGRGPGSFTGVRIGVATAKGLAHGAGIPLYGVGTLDAIAWRIAEDLASRPGEWPAALGDGPVALGVVGDAMRGEVYPARFELSGGRARRLEVDRVAKPDDLVAEWAAADTPLLLAGNGLHKYRARFAEGLAERGTFVPTGLWSPSGAGLLLAYAGALESGADVGTGEPGALLPVYTRLSDAEEAERARAGAPVAPPASGVSGPGAGEEPKPRSGREGESR